MNWLGFKKKKKHIEPQPIRGSRRIVKSDDNLYIIQTYYDGWTNIGRSSSDLKEVKSCLKMLEELERKERLDKSRHWEPI